MNESIRETGSAFQSSIRPVRALSLGRRFRSSMKKRWTLLSMVIIGGCLMTTSIGEAFQGYNVVITTDPLLEQTFLDNTTNQFQANLVANPLSPASLPVYQINLTGPGEPPTVVGNSLNDCMSAGFADGMDAERWATIQIMKTLQNNDNNNTACAGVVVDSTTAAICQTVYNNIGGIIAQRWLEVYSSTGGVVAQ